MQNIEFGVVTQKTIINVEEGYPLKTFAPVGENGEIANNGDAYGIVIDALGIGEVKQLVVMTAGCIDKICAEQHYGESYSAEAISALENIVIYDNHKIGGGGGAIFVINYDTDGEGNPTVDKQFSDIYEAVNDGVQICVVNRWGELYQYSDHDDDYVTFSRLLKNEEGINHIKLRNDFITINDDGSVTERYETYKIDCVIEKYDS